MNLDTTTDPIHRVLSARRYLILARMKAQEAEAWRLAAKYNGNIADVALQLQQADRKHKQAKTLRANVKRLLVEEEIEAGREFCRNGYTKRGARNLAGNQFKQWYYYRENYFLSAMGDIWNGD